MAFLKGPRIGNVVTISQPVKFLQATQFINATPWANTWFVDGENGSDSGSGLETNLSKATIDAAVQLVGRGDTIYVRPKAYVVGTGFGRYTETATVDLTQSDLSIIGVTNSINPEYGVRWARTTATYSLISDGPAVHLENIGFYSEGATGTALLRNNGATNTQRGTDGTTFYNCVIKAGRVFGADGGDGLTFRNCMFHAAPAGGATGGITYTCSANPGRRLRILDCTFLEGNAVAGATEYINIAGTCSEILIDSCVFGLIPTSGKFILITSSNGVLSRCHFAKADVHVTNDLTLSNVVNAGNFDGSAAGFIA